MTEYLATNLRKMKTSQCKTCSSEFENPTSKKVYCSVECRPTVEKECQGCKQPFAAKKKSEITCSTECWKQVKAIRVSEKNKLTPGAVTCKICNLCVGKQIMAHLKNAHATTVPEYKVRFDMSADSSDGIIAPSTKEKYREKIAGEKNPWFNHGGKLSVFSKSYEGYEGLTEEEKEAKVKAVVESIERPAENMPNRIEYYLARGMDEEEARAALSERQTTFSLEKCIEKYGEEAGLARWQERQEKWQSTLAAKPAEEQARINKAKMAASGSISKTSRKLFAAIHVDGARWGLKSDAGGGEIYLPRPDVPSKHYAIDFVYGNKAIEFNGDYWHACPKKYQSDDLIGNGHRKVKAETIWEADAKKVDFISSQYELLIIWESEYHSDPEGTVEKCREFLKS